LLYAEASFNFFLLTFYLKYFPGNIFSNSAFYACSDVIAFIFAGVFVHYTGTRTSLLTGSGIAISGGVAYLLMSQNVELVPIVICMARIGQTMIFNTMIISIGRLFPTLYVSTAYGLVNFCGHLAACFSPFLAEI
jgi:hypothetical protein